jgi:type IV pilus assembly protein PilC
MALYTFTAKDANGRELTASVTAASRYEALGDLRERNLTVLSLTEAAAQQEHAPVPSSLPKNRPLRKVLQGRVSLSEKATFCRQMAVSVSSGVPLRDSLESIAEDVENPLLKRTLTHVIQSLHNGRAFSESLAAHPKVFEPLIVALIKTAEESGTMAETLEDLAGSLERTERLIRKVRSVTAYPIFVAGFFCLVLVIMTLFVVPQFQRAFAGFRSDLPVLTRTIFALNRMAIAYFPVAVAVLLLAVGAFVMYARTERGQLRVDGWKLQVPLFGQWLRKFSVARFCRNLAMMLRGGVPISSALEIAAATCGNKALERALLYAREKIINGAGITQSLAEQKMFPHLVVRMVSVGESSGRLPEVLEKVSDVYEDQVEGSIMTATALFEPVAICVFGAIILVLVLAIYLPVFTMASNIR